MEQNSVDKVAKNTGSSVAANFARKQIAAGSALQDNRLSTIIQKKQIDALSNVQPHQTSIQKKANNTGLPDNLKNGVENLSGIAMDDVSVHYNSAKPAQLNAHAYAQGTDIHVAPGQEKHLPHEAWHVVQQKQGRVKPTLQMKTSAPLSHGQPVAPTIQLIAMPPAAARQRLSPIKNSIVQLLGWSSLGRLNPRRYIPEVVGGYSAKQMEEPLNHVADGPLATLGHLNPRRYIPTLLGGYSAKQMEEPQNQLQGGPLTALGHLNPRRHLPEAIGGYTEKQMKEPQNKLDGGPLTVLGRLNPRRYLPESKGGYTEQQMQEPQNRLEGGPLASLGKFNPRLHLPKMLGGYNEKQMMEPQNYTQGPLSTLGWANPRLHLPTSLGGYDEKQMKENWNPHDTRMPVKGPNPLAELGPEHWWRLFMDKKFQDKKENKDEPGMFFDKDKSPGYNQSMMEAFHKAIIQDRGKKVNYERYTEYHDLVSGHIRPKEKNTDMRRLGGFEAASYFKTPIIPAEGKEEKLSLEQEAERVERQKTYDEMKDEKVHDRPLLTGSDKSKAHNAHGKPVTLYTHVPNAEPQKAHTEMRPRYPVADGRLLVNSILSQHYDANHKASSKEMIRSIAKTIRALHVGHFFVDGNGRHNVFLLMNKLLVDGGHKPSILPHGPEVFGGLKTIDSLVKDIEEGMGAFEDLVKSTNKPGEGVKKGEDVKKKEA